MIRQLEGQDTDTGVRNPTLAFARLRIEMVSLGPTRLPVWPGSMLRGAFGHALKAAFCTIPHGRCRACLLQKTCGYFSVFETESAGRRSEGFYYMPHPYVIEPRRIEEHETHTNLDWHLLLLGPSVRYAPYLVRAFQAMGARGLGKGRFRFRLTGVWDELGEENLMDMEAGVMELPKSADLFSLAEDFEKTAGVDPQELVLCLATPLRIEKQGRALRSLNGELLREIVFRRVRLLCEAHGSSASAVPAIAEPSPIELSCIEEDFVRIERYSSRQKRKLELRGIVGRYRIVRASPDWLKWLYLASILHIGKNTTFGFGQIRLEHQV